MALARVVSFEGVSKDRMDEMNREIGDNPAPEGLDASEVIILHDAEGEKSLAIVFFEDEDSYRRGDEILDAMPAGDTPGRRTSVTRYAVAIRVLGSLIEKQRTTPDAYPLSLNALRLACNQSTNRDPVVDYDERTVRDAL